MNPVLLGLQRQREAEAAQRAAMIRMEIAGNTGYLNPQMYTNYLTGVTAVSPSSAAASPMIMGMPGLQGSPVYQKFPVPGTLPSGFQQQNILSSIVPQAYISPQNEVNAQQMAMIQAILYAEAEKQRIMSRYVRIF